MNRMVASCDRRNLWVWQPESERQVSVPEAVSMRMLTVAALAVTLGIAAPVLPVLSASQAEAQPSTRNEPRVREPRQQRQRGARREQAQPRVSPGRLAVAQCIRELGLQRYPDGNYYLTEPEMMLFSNCTDRRLRAMGR